VKNKASYYNQVRDELFPFIPLGNHRILEIGCGEGKTLLTLKKTGRAKFLAGVDLYQPAIDRAKKDLDWSLAANIEEVKLPFESESFDYIILADILEHLIDPWKAMVTLRRFLKKEGFFIISFPNIRNYQILKKLIINDDWFYQEKGILDKTHLRFFTLKSMAALLSQANLKIIDTKANAPELNRPLQLLDFLLGRQLSRLMTVQYLLKVGRI
jgi:O-antigen biosynthesis protein